MIPPSPSKLRKLVGKDFPYQGIDCRVVDVIEDGPALVLQDRSRMHSIQLDQYGNASRRGPRIITVAVLNIRRDGLNPAIQKLLA